MSVDDFSLDDLPEETRKKLKELALKMAVPEEQIAAKMLSLVLSQCEDPTDQGLRDFVKKAKQAMKGSS